MTTNMLPSWNEGPTKQAIVDFVTSTTRQGPNFIDPADRIATVDNDGTLRVEQPAPPQLDLASGEQWNENVRSGGFQAPKRVYV